MRHLDEYRRKRNFERTPEPAGPGRDVADVENLAEEGGVFIIHKHAAQRLHYDLRLEMNGVLRSWAVPKGPSLTPGEKRLAVHVEDHPLEYGEFEGTIPDREYGGGTVMLWDRGRWAPVTSDRKGHRKKNSDPNRIDFVLVGEKLRGVWTLVRTSSKPGEKADNWLLIKRQDKNGEHSALTDFSVATGRSMKQIAEGADSPVSHESSAPSLIKETSQPLNPERTAGAKAKAFPTSLKPALASLTDEAPAGKEWVHEIKFDGYRILAEVRKGKVRLLSRNGKDWSQRFPEIAVLLETLNCRDAVLDGEVIALAQDGTSSFRMLQDALAAGDTRGLIYQLFDLVYLDGYDLSAAPLVERKQLLQELLQSTGAEPNSGLRYTDHIQGQGPEFIAQACRLALEGIISKRADGRYWAGQRKNWLKVKCTAHQELVICGYTNPGGKRTGFGSLLLSAWHGDELIYAGKVGTGFSDRMLDRLHKQLRKLELEDSPVANPPADKGVHWVRPELVAEVEFTEWTRDGVLRHPSFRGLREDKNAKDIALPEAAKHALNQPRGPKTSGRYPAPTRRSGVSKQRDTATVAGVTITNASRVLYPEQGVTKLQIAQYYEEIADHLLRQIAYRPLSLVRCPTGYTGECFFQKHPRTTLTKAVPQIQLSEKAGKEPYLYIEKISDVIQLVQAGALELHVWGSRTVDVERPDILVFDLDPAPGVPLKETLRVARELKARLLDLGLDSFPRTTGGKGLHLVVPLQPSFGWETVKAFSQGVAQAHAQSDRTRVTSTMAKSKRHGRIFLDYLRNGRGATAIASYSTRARTNAPVAVPVAWEELTEALQPNLYTIENLRRRMSAQSADPWGKFDIVRKPLTEEMLEAVGVKPGGT